MPPSSTPSLVSGRLAADVRLALDRLSRRLLRVPVLLAPGGLDAPLPVRRTRVLEAGLFRGAAGLAVTHAVLEEVLPGRGHGCRAQRWIELAENALASRPLPAAFGAGFTGIAWAVEQLSASDEDRCGPIDAALEDLLTSAGSPWPGHADLVSGLVGFGLYSIGRLSRPSGARLLELVLRRLGETAQARGPGLAWETPLHLLPPSHAERVPRPCFDLGLAHGVAGVIALLAGALSRGAGGAAARALLSAAVSFLLAERLPHGERAAFASFAGLRVPGRSAWCYGDPGVAVALLLAARATGDSGIERTALQIALDAAARSTAPEGAAGAGVCHGTASLAHLFHRLHLCTGEAAFARAARRWLRRIVAGQVMGIDPSYRGDPAFWAGPGMLDGAAGVALTLASALAPATAGWDRALLLSFR